MGRAGAGAAAEAAAAAAAARGRRRTAGRKKRGSFAEESAAAVAFATVVCRPNQLSVVREKSAVTSNADEKCLNVLSWLFYNV